MFHIVSYVMGKVAGVKSATGVVEIENGITCTDDGEGNVTITEDEEGE